MNVTSIPPTIASSGVVALAQLIILGKQILLKYLNRPTKPERESQRQSERTRNFYSIRRFHAMPISLDTFQPIRTYTYIKVTCWVVIYTRIKIEKHPCNYLNDVFERVVPWEQHTICRISVQNYFYLNNSHIIITKLAFEIIRTFRKMLDFQIRVIPSN